ncbi:MAG: 2Fe-2S iron-sulfur cluster binding domain-containing protein [Acidaminobacteraceae bacterium]
MNPILTSLLMISSISGSLALLLSVANKTIGNYGEVKLSINKEKEYIVDGGDTLLSTLVEQEIFIPSACGGKGSCGYCKIHVKSGGGQLLATERGYVTEQEAEEGIRLSCQLKVKEDIQIEIPAELFNVKQYDYIVNGLDPVTPKIKHVKLALPKDKKIEFKAGQFIQILTPTYKGNDEEVYRAYSIASSPAEKDHIELFIGYIPEGKCSTYIHQHLKENEKLTVVGPFGDFCYQDNNNEMIMVAIGTGMAPIMSILKHMRSNNIDRKCTFYFGARTVDDLYMMDELEALEKDMPNFTLLPVLSRPKTEDNWTGETGRVTDMLEKYVLDGVGKEAYLCGSPVMIDAVVEILIAKGIPENLVMYDKFE